MEDKIEINLNYTTVLIAFTLNFIVINLANVTFFYNLLLPYFANKIKKILNININKYYKIDLKYNKKTQEEILKSNRMYLKETLDFYAFIVFILIVVNVILYYQDQKYYLKNLIEYLTFKNIRNMIFVILFSILVHFLYSIGFAFKYYLYIIYKYIFEILKLN